MKEYLYIKGLQIEKRYSESNVHHEVINELNLYSDQSKIEAKHRYIPIIDFHKKVVREGREREDRIMSIEGETYDVDSVYIAVSPEVEKYLRMPFSVMNDQLKIYGNTISGISSELEDTKKELRRFRKCFERFNNMSRIKQLWQILRHGYI